MVAKRLEVLEVSLSEGVAYDFEQLKRLPALRRLKLDGPVDDSQASQLAELEHLTQLVLSSDAMTDVGVRELARLPLVQLRLEAPRVTDEAMASIGTIKALRFLHLLRVGLTDAGLAPLQDLPNLESLYLDGASCTDEGLSRLLKARPDLHFHRDQVHLKDDPHDHPH